MMLDQHLDFRLLLRRKFQTLCRAVERSEAACNVIFHRHAFAHVMQKQRENQQVAPFRGFPELYEVRSALVRRIGQLLQVFDGA